MDQRLQDPAMAAPPDWRGLCEELFEALDGWHKAVFETGTSWVRPDETYLLDRARAALAQPEPEGRPVPAPAGGEVGELVTALKVIDKMQQEWVLLGNDNGTASPSLTMPISLRRFTVIRDALTRAADLLERQAAPVPVPVSERLPGVEDCDEEGFCWWFSPADPSAGTFGVAACWVLRKPEPEDDFRTHWLPAHALPLPSDTERGGSNE